VRTLSKRSTQGPTIEPAVSPSALVYSPQRQIGPGGGYTWGSGPRRFVGPTGAAPTRIELGRPGDFVDGEHTWGPAEGDLGFPYATRWPGWPGAWTPPFFEPPGSSGGWGRFMGGAMIEARVSTVFACTDLISRTLATMRIQASRESSPVVPPPWTDNPEPELYTSIVDAFKAVVNSTLIRGEAFLYATARYADDSVARWAVLNPDMVNVETGTGGRAVYTMAGTELEFRRADILHIRYQVWPGQVRGVGPLEAAWRNVLSADALESWGTSLAVNNGIPTAVLQSTTKLTKQQATDLKISWAESAMSRGIWPAVLSGGLTYTPLNLKPSDIGLLDLRRFDEQRIASCFGVPLWLVGLPMQDGLTYSTVEGTFDYLWRATLRALSHNIMQALSGWAVPRGTWLRQDSESLIRPAMPERANAYKTLLDAGVTTVDEVRVMENLAPMNAETLDTLAKTTEGGL
jgi:HK97 family phage portal protein